MIFNRYSASTVDVMKMMDDDKVDLNLIAALIRHIVLEEEVSFLCFSSKNIILILYIKAMKKKKRFLKIAYGRNHF